MLKLKSIANTSYSIIVFLSITLFTSLAISTIQSLITDSITNGSFIKESARDCTLLDINKLSKQELLNSLKNTPNLYIEKSKLEPGAYSGKAIYYNNDPFMIPNIVSGKYFSESNFIDNKPVAVVGKEILKSAKEIDGKKFFEYENIKYEIIGVMGYENRSSISDMQFIINFNAYIANSNIPLTTSNYIVDSNIDTKYTFDILISEFNKYIPKFEYEDVKINNKGIINQFIIEGFNSSILFIVLIILIFLNVFNITLQWVESKKKTLGIKKALGCTNLRLSMEIVGEYQLIALCSYAIGMAMYICIIKFKLIPIFNADIYILTTLITFIFSSLTALAVSLIAIVKAIKIPPSIVMKGGKI